MITPNLFLIGAQKGGSSTVYAHLRAHPAITHLGRKEINVFNAPDVATARARLSALSPRFPDRPLRIDASVDYARYPKFAATPENIHAICGDDVRFIYVIRNPVERMISNLYWTNQLYGGVADLAEAIRLDPQMVETSRYDVQLERYLRLFPVERFWFMTLDALSADPQGEMDRLCRWLGIAPQPLAAPETRRGATNKTVTRKLRVGAFGRLLRGQTWLRDLVRAILPDKVARRIARALTVEAERREPTRAEKRALMDAHFRDSVIRTAALTGLDLKAWIDAYD